ncbi:MAG: hypothetical protein GY865_13200 [candidate division Zixibacteria bacterium]|nr:hypothetical protein [candidate division Zixibacteria bacterium]
MDTANQLMVIDYEDKHELKRAIMDIPDLNIIYKIEFFKGQGINILICGAISTRLYHILAASHIKVIPFIGGSIQEIVTAYINGDLQNGDYFLPGCRNNKNGFGRKRNRRQGKY